MMPAGMQQQGHSVCRRNRSDGRREASNATGRARQHVGRPHNQLGQWAAQGQHACLSRVQALAQPSKAPASRRRGRALLGPAGPCCALLPQPCSAVTALPCCTLLRPAAPCCAPVWYSSQCASSQGPNTQKVEAMRNVPWGICSVHATPISTRCTASASQPAVYRQNWSTLGEHQMHRPTLPAKGHTSGCCSRDSTASAGCKAAAASFRSREPRRKTPSPTRLERTVVKQLAQGRGVFGAPRLLAVQAVHVQVEEDGSGTARRKNKPLAAESQCCAWLWAAGCSATGRCAALPQDGPITAGSQPTPVPLLRT